jgi:hypothetical protein
MPGHRAAISPAILVARNNSATITAVEHALPFYAAPH